MSKMKKKNSHFLVLLQNLYKRPLAAKIYVVLAVTVLLLTTLYWSIFSAQIHASNGDQLVNTYLFEHSNTFHDATFPDQHPLLFKWPIFLLVTLFGSTSLAFTVATALVTLLTVAALAYFMYRIERRPLLFGTLCLAFASALLLIPSQPYPGAILPVNMAMITTRNLEYIVFIASLVLIVRSTAWRSWRFITACILMALLIASDKLFLTIS